MPGVTLTNFNDCKRQIYPSQELEGRGNQGIYSDISRSTTWPAVRGTWWNRQNNVSAKDLLANL